MCSCSRRSQNACCWEDTVGSLLLGTLLWPLSVPYSCGYTALTSHADSSVVAYPAALFWLHDCHYWFWYCDRCLVLSSAALVLNYLTASKISRCDLDRIMTATSRCCCFAIFRMCLTYTGPEAYCCELYDWDLALGLVCGGVVFINSPLRWRWRVRPFVIVRWFICV